MTRRSDPFTRVPLTVDQAIDSGRILPRQGEMAKRLLYKCGRAGRVDFTLAELEQWLREWPLTREQLRLDLLGLAAWFEIRSPGRGKAVWSVVRLGDDLDAAWNSNSKDVGASPHGNRREIPNEAKTTESADADADGDEVRTAGGLPRSRNDVDPLLARLVEEIADADGRTLSTYARLGSFSEFQLVWVRSRLAWKRKQADRPQSEAAYVYDLLNNIEKYMSDAEDAA